MFVWLTDVLTNINNSYLPEWTGDVLAKSVRFVIDYVLPLVNKYIEVIFG